ncbi:dynactin p62 family domain-containing protein [Rhizoctonia solani AG-1 IA]|uniref:Dynactin subunit 4 n=1 Tax=Thanatephorus cucumeris (strain AG1-IA) TaxID=983506 RepID=L8WJP9_THACA|nr:dynactin p62 family domain-containing protein [Rhizoctonia solani AG-1 IA]
MQPSLNYHCACSATLTTGPVRQPPLATLESSGTEFHPLTSLYFCEECDAVRCPRCVALEVTPNAFNLAVDVLAIAFNAHIVGILFLSSRLIRLSESLAHGCPSLSTPWANRPLYYIAPFVAGILRRSGFRSKSQQDWHLQRFEDSAPETLEFDRLKDHFEPLIRASGTGNTGHTPNARHNPITAAASHALAREVHGVPRHQLNKGAGRSGKTKPRIDPWDSYIARNPASGGDATTVGASGGPEEVEWMRNLDNIEDVAPVEARWDASWSGSLRARYAPCGLSPFCMLADEISSLAPLRIPLHSKMSVRCAVCRHILIKPEQKSQSVRYKIKLMASNYLPSLEASLSSSTGVSRLVQGRSCPFSVTITNPLYDSIQVRLQPYNPATYPNVNRPNFHVALPQGFLSVAAFAEAWEYDEDDEDMEQDQMVLDALEGGAGLADAVKAGTDVRLHRGKSGTIGILEKRANMIRIGGEVAVSRDGSGDIKFTMLVTYQYRAEEPADEQPHGHTDRGAASQVKSFSFLTMVNLGPIASKEPTRGEHPNS